MVVLAKLLLLNVGGGRERLWKALSRAVGVVYIRARDLLLVHDARVLGLLQEKLFPPNTL